jgi:hypothetical protein
MAVVGPIFEAGVQTGGAPRPWSASATSPAAGIRQLEPALRQRVLGSGRALFGTELGWERYRPDDATLAMAILMPGRRTVQPGKEAGFISPAGRREALPSPCVVAAGYRSSRSRSFLVSRSSM